MKREGELKRVRVGVGMLRKAFTASAALLTPNLEKTLSPSASLEISRLGTIQEGDVKEAAHLQHHVEVSRRNRRMKSKNKPESKK